MKNKPLYIILLQEAARFRNVDLSGKAWAPLDDWQSSTNTELLALILLMSRLGNASVKIHNVLSSKESELAQVKTQKKNGTDGQHYTVGRVVNLCGVALEFNEGFCKSIIEDYISSVDNAFAYATNFLKKIKYFCYNKWLT